MIKINDLSKNIGSFTLKAPEISIPSGYICGLVGLNGAGKTTLLHLILGLYKEDKGKVLINSLNYEKNRKEILDDLGTVLVEDLLDSGLSLNDNGLFYGKNYTNYDHNAFLTYLKAFGLDENKGFGKLSKGQKKKAEFAFALAHKPKLLILDEPTANFDPEFREVFFATIKDFIKDGQHTVLLATHLTEDLDRMADYLIYVESGNIVYSGELLSFLEGYRLVSGEKYKINLLPKDIVIKVEEKAYETTALVNHNRLTEYDSETLVRVPNIEEFMYYYSKRKETK